MRPPERGLEFPLAKARGTLRFVAMSKAEVLAELPRLTRQEREEIRLRIVELEGRMEITVQSAAVQNPPPDATPDYRPKRAAQSTLWSDAEARWLEKLARRCGETEESAVMKGTGGQAAHDDSAGFHGA
jgi:hypothetical protein